MSEESNQASDGASALTIDKIVDERGVPLGNKLKELDRKLGRINEVNAKLDMLLQNNVAQPTPDKGYAKAAANYSVDGDTKAYIDARLHEEKQASVTKAQKVALETVYKTFPELHQSSDDFDTEFFNLAVEYEQSIAENDPQRPLKAAKLAALDLGKVEKITKSKILQDENRRSRVLSEGASPVKEGKASQAPKLKMNENRIKQYFKLDPKVVEKFVKEEES